MATEPARTDPYRERKDSVLRGSKLRYRRVFEAAQDGILILEADSGVSVAAKDLHLKNILTHKPFNSQLTEDI